jgi:hypothetical protein
MFVKFFSLHFQGRPNSPNGVKETVHRFDDTVPARLIEDPSTDEGSTHDALTADSEKGLVKLSSV